MPGRSPTDWLEYLRKAADLPIGYSVDDLLWFKRIAERQYPALVPMIDACVYLVQESNFEISPEGTPRQVDSGRSPEHTQEFFEIFQDPRLFPKNLDLIRFATEAMPDLKPRRFDKMSRGDIALRLVQHLEKLPPKTRQSLEASMREAVAKPTETTGNGRTFFSKWQSIIRDLKK